MNIDTSLLREKFVIQEAGVKDEGQKKLILTAPSNRMPISLRTESLAPEQFIVRTSSMHTCTRMVAQLVADYEHHGPIPPRIAKINWHQLWDNCLSSYERLHIPERWCCVYHKGKNIFSEGKHHAFLDVIEKCDHMNKKDYEGAINVAKGAFTKAGKEVHIDYDSNVALVAAIDIKSARCSMVLRGIDKTTTFNYSVRPIEKDDKINPSQALSSAGDFLEGVQLSYQIGMNNHKLETGQIQKFSDPDRKARAARNRINELYAQVNSLENRYILRYRPERPDFDHIIHATEQYLHQEYLAKKNKA